MRYELKFVMPEENLPYLYEWLMIHKGFQRAYPDREVHSIYFDSLDLHSASENLAGIADRTKHRLRWYSCGGEDYGTRYEIKVKRAALGTKLLKPCSLAPRKVLRMRGAEIASHVSNDPDCRSLGDFSTLYPVLLVQYERSYYESFAGIRVTLDRKLQFTNILNDDQLRDEDKIAFDDSIVEIKFSPEHRDYVSESMTDFPLRPTHMSKYLLGMSLSETAIYL